MRPCLKAEEIKRDIREQLPEIDEFTFQDHFCKVCPYYAGRVNHKARCMQKSCAWDDEKESFSPILMKMIPVIEEEFDKAEKQYLEAKRRREVIHQMFKEELLLEKKKKDACYNCPYSRQAPCVGFCYKQMTSDPVDPAGADKPGDSIR